MLKKVELSKTVFKQGNYPFEKDYEIAFVGRSNVGKSSLLNAIFDKKLAHISSTPGKTRSINFYTVEDRYYFVDLPGYGYARASKTETQKWSELIKDYFENRKSLSLVVLLLDSRHSLQKNDSQMIDWLSFYGIPFIAVLTKVDKLSGNQLAAAIKNFKRELAPWGHPTILPVSSVNKKGIEELLEMLIV